MQVMSPTSSIYDHFYHLTVKCDLGRQPTDLHFFHKESQSKKNVFFFIFFYFLGGLGGGGGGGVGGVRGGRCRWMDRGTSPNQFAPSTFSKLGS